MKVYDSQGRLKVVGFTGPAGTQSVTCAELSATASVLSASIQIASAAATSVDARVNSVNTALSGISARSVGNISTHGLQSVVDALSNRVSAVVAGTGSVTSAEVQVASAAATSADLHAAAASAAATSADAHVNTVSARVVSVSAELASLVQIASAAATSADAHANTASAAATSADAHANTVSARAVSISAELASLVQIASAAATSADGHANTVSARAVSISAELASLVQIASAAATSADAHANAASAAATSVDGRIASLSAGLASISVRSAGNVSTHGLQSAFNALSNRISGVTGGAGSVTSNELSAAVEGLKFLNLTNEDNADVSAGGPVFLVASAASAFHLATNVGNPGDQDAVGLATSLIAIGTPGIVQTQGILSLTSAQWDDTTGQTGGLTIGSKYYVDIPGKLTVTPPTGGFVRPVGTAIAATKMLINPGLVDDFGAFLASISALSTDGSSVKGLQSVVNALSARIDFTSNGASLANVHANTVSARVVSVSAELASLLASASAALRADITSVSAVIKADIASVSAAIRADEASHIASTSATIKADIASVSAAIMADAASHLASTSAAIKTDINSVSAAIMADVASHLASASAAIMADAASHLASTSVVLKADLTSVSAVIKADINSVSAAIINEMSVQFGRGQFKMLTTGAQAVATATFTKVSGLSLSIAGSGFYQVNGQLIWSQSGAGSASAIFNFGMSMTAQPVMALFRMQGNIGALAAAAGLSAWTQFGGNSAICATPSIMYSAKPNPGVSGSVANCMFFDGVIQASTVQSQLKVVVACSTAAFGVAIQPGSYIRAYKIG